MGDGLTHSDEHGRARMVDVSGKPATVRRARAEASVFLGAPVAELLARHPDAGVGKGPVLETARLAGIQAAKRTWELIPLCHNIALDHVDVRLAVGDDSVHIEATAAARAPTGVEMEALVAASVAALTVYDMVKAVARGAEIRHVRLLEKQGGKSGLWRREQ